MTAAGNSVYVAVDTPILSIREGIFETSYYGYPIELTLPGVCTSARFVRRYSDFESLRNQLRAEHWYCIIAPIPEKESLHDKISPKDSNPGSVLEYRRIALRRFLLRVACHPILGKSPLLAKFPYDEAWRGCVKNPLVAPPFLAGNLAEEWVKSLPSAAAPDDGAAYGRLLHLDVAAALEARAIDRLQGYVVHLEDGLRRLREGFHGLARGRRTAGEGLVTFATALEGLAADEADVALRAGIGAVRDHAAAVSCLYHDQSDRDLQTVGSTLGFYVGMCAAVRQALGGIESARNVMRALQRRVRNAEAKLASEGGANLAAARSSFATLTAEKMHLEREMCGVEKTFKEEFGRFHHEKQYDMREFLKVFGELEIAFASSLKSKGEELRPLLADLES